MSRPLRSLLEKLDEEELETLRVLSKAFPPSDSYIKFMESLSTSIKESKEDIKKSSLIDNIIDEIKEDGDTRERPKYEDIVKIAADGLGVKYDSYDDVFDIEEKVARKALKISLSQLDTSDKEELKRSMKQVASSSSKEWDQSKRDLPVNVTSTFTAGVTKAIIGTIIGGPLGFVLATASSVATGYLIKKKFLSKPKIKKIIRCIIFVCLMRKKYEPNQADYSKIDALLN